MENNKKHVDFIDRHRILSRLIVVSIIAVFIYSFMLPLDIRYAELTIYSTVAVLMVLTFGINVLDKIIEIVEALKGK